MRKITFLLTVFALLQIKVYAQEYTPDANTVALYHFNEISGSTVYDSSGNGNNGVATGTTIVEGKFGKARSFNGSSNCVIVPYSSSLAPPNAITVECWVRFNSLQNDNYARAIIDNRNSPSGQDYVMYSYPTVDKIFFEIGINGSYQSVEVGISENGISAGVWYHLAGTYDGTKIRMYLNGVLKDSLNASGTIAYSNSPLYIGWNCFGYSYNVFDGLIDEVRISNRARQPWEFNVPLRYGLVAYYPFSGNANDESGNGHDGTVFGATLSLDRFGHTNSAYEFSSDNSYITADGIGVDTVSGDLNTVSFWMLWTGTTHQMPFAFDTPLYDLWFTIYSPNFGFNTGESNVIGTPYDGFQNNWVHVVAVFYNGVPSASNCELYINGEEKTLAGNASANVAATRKIFIGAWRPGEPYQFLGKLDDIRIYNRALSQPEIDSIYHEGGWQPPINVSVSDGWNMVSVPFVVPDYSKLVLIPSAISDAFTYLTSYVVHDTLQKGVGYWMKFQSSNTIPFNGDSILQDTFNVRNGWNMIGAISEPFAVSSITSEPPGIVTSDFFGYTGSYVTSDTIYPGNGYWVKVNQDGQLILSSTTQPLSKARIKIVPTSEMPPSPPSESTGRIELPKEYRLEQNYPNPFNPITIIKYGLPSPSNVKLKIFNVLGQVVATLKDEEESAGYKQIEWNSSAVASGIYFYRLEATSISDPSKSFTQVRKMILIK